ncbi:hypothetical protein BaRGS_00023275, partial [Batillaria attramentaria]
MGMWTVANVRILKVLMKSKDFDVSAYLKYTEMVGELACRFRWASVILFDEEYRQLRAFHGEQRRRTSVLSSLTGRLRQQQLRAGVSVATTKGKVRRLGSSTSRLLAGRSASSGTGEAPAHSALGARLNTRAQRAGKITRPEITRRVTVQATNRQPLQAASNSMQRPGNSALR